MNSCCTYCLAHIPGRPEFLRYGDPICRQCHDRLKGDPTPMSVREQIAAREALKWREAAERAEERADDMEARAKRTEMTLADLVAWLRAEKLSGIDAKAIHKALLDLRRESGHGLGLT
ncbi:MAG: hypothetical protein ACXVXN_02035 [Mycobacteriaceae bacterium]